MTDLSPEAAALFKDARSKHDPSDADCLRVQSALHARLGIAPALASARLADVARQVAEQAPAAAPASTAGTLLATKASKLILATVLLSGAAVGVTSWPHTPVPASAPRAVIEQAVRPLPESTQDAALPRAPSDPPATPPRVRPAPQRAREGHGSSRARTRLHEPRASTLDAGVAAATAPPPSEIALLRRALTSLRDHDPDAALALLETHARLYPSGLFAKERDGTRVLALCAAGRLDEGRRARAAFLAASGRSPVAARVQLACRAEQMP